MSVLHVDIVVAKMNKLLVQLILDFLDFTRGKTSPKYSFHRSSGFITILGVSSIFGTIVCSKCGERLSIKQYLRNYSPTYLRREETKMRCPSCRKGITIQIYE